MPKSKSGTTAIVPSESIERHIYLIRGHKVMLDADLARKFATVERRYDRKFRVVFQAINRLIEAP